MANRGFFELVYQVVSLIPKGKVTTYGAIAEMLGNNKMARQVGWALHANPYFGKVPCHRVVNRKGQLSSGFAFGGIEVQRQMLLDEGVEVDKNNEVDLYKYIWMA